GCNHGWTRINTDTIGPSFAEAMEGGDKLGKLVRSRKPEFQGVIQRTIEGYADARDSSFDGDQLHLSRRAILPFKEINPQGNRLPYARSMYLPVRVSILIRSPVLMKRGA